MPTIIATGINLTTGATSTSAQLPPASSGTVPFRVRIASTANARVRIGISTVSAQATDTLVTPYEPLVLVVPRGLTHVAALQDTATGTVNIVPLEDC